MLRRVFLLGVFAATLAALFAQASRAARPAAATAAPKKLSFNDQIQPILAENCHACHDTDPGSRKADLRLDRLEQATAKRQDGSPALVPGRPGDSPLVQRIESKDEKKVMPLREPPNLDPHKQQVRAYVDNGDYGREIAAVAARARAWIEQRAARGGAKLTAVFDLDETLLSNWPLIRQQDFGYVPAEWARWVEEGQAPAIEPVREVLLAARRLGIEVVILTGRRERDRAGTEKNLRAIGCGDYAALLCQPDNSKETTGRFKAAAHARLEGEGRVIIASLGDQVSDFEGGHAERIFRLPNPFYLIE